jgi:hypothetical protein
MLYEVVVETLLIMGIGFAGGHLLVCLLLPTNCGESNVKLTKDEVNAVQAVVYEALQPLTEGLVQDVLHYPVDGHDWAIRVAAAAADRIAGNTDGMIEHLRLCRRVADEFRKNSSPKHRG